MDCRPGSEADAVSVAPGQLLIQEGEGVFAFDNRLDSLESKGRNRRAQPHQ
jgi:hypothetical protein